MQECKLSERCLMNIPEIIRSLLGEEKDVH